MAQKQQIISKLGDSVWAKIPKANAELFSLTYGSMVMQLIKDNKEDIVAVNAHLEKMGYNIGVRLIDEFLSKSGISDCSNFKDTADVIAKVAFKMFLGITADVGSWSADSNSFSLIIIDNPIVEFVELPAQYRELHYCNLLCGVIRGALEMVQLRVECRFVRDVLKGDDVSEVRVELKEIMKTSVMDDYKEN